MTPFPSTSIDTLKSLPSWILLIFAIGSFFVLKSATSLLRWLYVYFFRPAKDLKSYGSWAVITGCTAGIGRAMASELAKKGLDLVLVGRNPKKLEKVSEEILAEFRSRKVKTVVIDFSGDVADGIERLRKVIEGMDVGVLVNNAGVMSPKAKYFHEMEEGAWKDVVKVNIEGLTMVTQAVLPGMVKRRRGAILNMGSGASVAIPAHPIFAVYAATKAYVDSFSRSLHVEYKNMGIDVQCQVPLYVGTKMAPHKSVSMFVPSAESYSRAAMRWIGYDARCMVSWSHSVQWWGVSLPPDFAVNSWRLYDGLRLRERGISFNKKDY